jgi:putative Mg2+ transporter-C (MgtC) family protein
VVLRPLGRVVDRRPEAGDETLARYEFQAVTRDDAQMEAAVSRLSPEPSVSSVRWEAVPA